MEEKDDIFDSNAQDAVAYRWLRVKENEHVPHNLQGLV